MKRLGKILVVCLVALLIVALCSCGKKKQSETKTETSSSTEELKKVTVSIHPSGHGLPAYIAEKMGYYTEEGLDVETLVYISAPPQMEAYQTGAWEIGTTGFGGIILGVAKKDLQILGSSIDDATVMALWARPDSNLAKSEYNEDLGCYGTAADWEGLEILFAQGTITDILLSSTLDRLGLTESAVVKTNMDAAPAYTAFKAGNGDLVQANASFYFNAQNDGYVPVTTGLSQELFMPSVMVASDKIIEERPDVVQAWLNAYMKGVQYIKDNPEKAAEMFVEFTEENGVTTDYDSALLFINQQISLIYGVEEQLEMFEKADGSDNTNFQNALATVMNYYIKMGKYTENDKAQLMLDENYNSSFMKNCK